MNALPSQMDMVPDVGYGASRFNALQHGMLSRHAVLPWEDRNEYQTLLDALVAEHAPQGPTEEHLVEELAGVIWRKRRLRLAEAAIYLDRIRSDTSSSYGSDHIAQAALLPRTGHTSGKANIPQALAATANETARDMRDVKRDRALSCKARSILAAGRSGAYAEAVAALGEDTRSYWLECLKDPPDNRPAYQPTSEALDAWLRRHWTEWYDGPIAEFQHREAIKDQAVGSAYTSKRLEVTARYEVHLDRKLERTLSMLLRLKDLRPRTEPA